MKKIIIYLISICISGSIFAQVQEGGTPESFELIANNLPNVTTFTYAFDPSEINSVNDSLYHVGVAEQVSIDFIESSNKFTSVNGIVVYRLLVEVKNTLGLGIDFSDFYLPNGGKLYAYNEDKTILLGAFTDNNNQVDRKFSIQPISGTKLILEYNQSAEINDIPTIQINRISKIYRPLFEDAKKSSDCYENVHCVNNIEVERSIMKWFFYDTKDEGYYICSCALVNQDVPSNNIKPYVLTANHCGKNADLSTAIFYFNYQNSTCTSNNANQYNYTLSGGSKRAKRSVFDMFLLELNTFPPPDYNVHLSGWNRSNRNDLPDQLMGIHHPEGKPKKISLGTFKANTNPNFWRVEWDINSAPTAGGSSGSPLFEDNNDRIIGWLSYGTSACDKIDGIDRYGKFRDAWSSILGSDSRLKDWLDPNNNDMNTIVGRDPCFTNLLITNRIFYSAQQRYQPENKVTVQTGNTLATSGNVIIKTGSEHKFSAGQEIVFTSDFTAELGSDFLAVLEPCDVIAFRMTNEQIKDNSELELLDKDRLSIYPNPTNGLIKINFGNLSSGNYELYSLDGRIILSNKYENSSEISIDLTNFANGVYVINIIANEKVISKKLIKE
ncbi:conserved exported hypothetical protein [Flavobacterium sp. 9AF]|uniref:T9SS type A sorting domain-containing protein n=1 Tax=Flavobacterium sp. 9AF TaxID=2653142 RepID=UPI0012F3DD1B|nr:T9SS type A sorting domain-containing protein [Flavobacterium sp. 9AF]VXB91755.1 conserved exported hypothetical protein [Flavobacterium sp. 9AF]